MIALTPFETARMDNTFFDFAQKRFEKQERGPDLLRLANAFSALYPNGSEEKRLVDAMLPAVPR